MVMSGDFRGFHVRFMPVARGGLRMIPSANPAAALRNRQTLFNENYGLAYVTTLVHFGGVGGVARFLLLFYNIPYVGREEILVDALWYPI